MAPQIRVQLPSTGPSCYCGGDGKQSQRSNWVRELPQSFTGGSVSGKPPVFEAGFGRSSRPPPANWPLAQSGSALRSERRGFRFDP